MINLCAQIFHRCAQQEHLTIHPVFSQARHRYIYHPSYNLVVDSSQANLKTPFLHPVTCRLRTELHEEDSRNLPFSVKALMCFI